jgi:predicted RNA-binding Zn ribbon-like protein
MSHDASKFFWVGGHPALDLVNTEAVDAGGDRLELVPHWADLVDWAATAGLIDPDLAEQCRTADRRRGRIVLAWFRQLRSGLRDALESGGDEPSAGGALDAAVAAVAVRLTYRPGQQRGALPVDASGPLERLRLALATTALDATQLDRSRVGRCGNERCVLLYYDSTKNRSRRWCDMAVCGNRAKASAYYRRHQHPPSPAKRRPATVRH